MIGVLTYLGSVVVEHKGVFTVAGTALGMAIAKNIPEKIPKSPQELWTWMRNSVQTALPISRMNGTNPTPPVTSPEETKK